VPQPQRIRAAVANRLRIQALLERRPEIRSLPIGKVLLITGLQRTGTTLLHRLIASHPEIRSLKAWEAMNPAPLPAEGRRGCGKRLRQAKAAERALRFLAPTFFAVHPVEHDAPEEDILLLDLSFTSQTPEATMHVPTYARWMEQQDHRPAYRYLATILRVLQWQRARPWWVLKTPAHLEHLDAVFETFPDVTVVQTHRDPQVAVTSFLSMVAHGRGVFSDQVDPGEVASSWSAKICRMIERSMAARSNVAPERFVDVRYADLMQDPFAELARIYAHVGIPFGATARRAATDATTRNVRNRYGRHLYNAGDFGVNRDSLECAFGAYGRRFGTPCEH